MGERGGGRPERTAPQQCPAPTVYRSDSNLGARPQRAERARVDSFVEGLLSDVLSDASARQWRARAATFRAARPTPADYPGERSIEDLREQWRELSAVAAACEARAHVLDTYPHEWPEVAAVLTETRDEAA